MSTGCKQCVYVAVRCTQHSVAVDQTALYITQRCSSLAQYTGCGIKQFMRSNALFWSVVLGQLGSNIWWSILNETVTVFSSK